MKHTETPWVVKHAPTDEFNGERYYVCRDGDSSIVVTCGRATDHLVKQAKANAEYIALAANNHEKLMIALKLCHDVIQSCLAGHRTPSERNGTRAVNAAREAMSLVKTN